MLSRFYLLPLARLHPKLAEDFHWGSAHAINLLKAWQEKQSVWKQHQLAVRHFFCTTTEDEKIYEPCGSLPLLEPLDQNQASSYQIYSGFTHQTIVPAAREDIFKWIKEGTG